MMHTALLELYEVYAKDYPGICHGFAVLWVSYYLMGQENDFEDLVKKWLNDEERDKILGNFEKNRDGKEKLSEETLSFLGFYDSLSMFQNPFQHSRVFNLSFINYLDLEQISAIASPKKIQEQGGVTTVYSECIFYNETEIVDYLTNLEEHLERIQKPEGRIGFLLVNKDHTVALGYEKGGWNFREINQEPVSNAKANAVAQAIIRGFSRKALDVAFNIRLVLTARDERVDELRKSLQHMKEGRIITPEVALRQAEGESLISIATLFNDIDLLQKLIAHIPDLKEAVSGHPVALIAAQFGYLEIIKLLVQRGVNVLEADRAGMTPLLFAAKHGHFEVVKFLIGLGAEIDACNSWGATPLLLAAQNGQVKVVEFLVQSEAEVEDSNWWGATPLWLASENGYAEVVKLLVSHTDVNQPSNGVLPLSVAAENGHLEVVKVLKAYTTDLNYPLWIAADKGYSGIVEVLADDETDINYCDGDGVSSLWVAAQNGHFDAVKILVEHGADINYSGNCYGKSPIFIAAQNGHFSVVTYLIEQKADLLMTYWIKRDHLIQIVRDKGPDAEYRLNDFLMSAPSEEDPEYIMLCVNNIAWIMGYDELAEKLTHQMTLTSYKSTLSEFSFFPSNPQETEEVKSPCSSLTRK